MAYSEARDRAVRKYRSINCTSVRVEFNRKYEQEIINFLATKQNKSAYIKSLIFAEMEKEKQKAKL